MKVDLITRLKHAYWDLTFLDLNSDNLTNQMDGMRQRLLDLIYDLEALKCQGDMPEMVEAKISN